MAARSTTTSKSRTTKTTKAATKPRSTTKATTAKAAKTRTAAKTATTTKKTAAVPPKAAITAPKAAPPPAPKVVEEAKPVVAGPVVKRPELVDRVVAETGLKKKDVKPVVEAMLQVMGRALADGEEMNLPPLGKVMINRVKELAKAKVIIVKVRQPHAAAPLPNPPLADSAEDS